MRNPDQVLREKERELERVKREVEALRLGGPLLEGEDTASDKAINPEPEARKEATTGQIVHGQKMRCQENDLRATPLVDTQRLQRIRRTNHSSTARAPFRLAASHLLRPPPPSMSRPR